MRKWMVGVLGLALLAAAFWGMRSEASGIVELRVPQPGSSPLTFLLPEGAAKGTRPLVLVAHGFAGSTELMRSFAYPLVHAGYVVALWDFDGHGANPRGLSQGGDLLAGAEAAVAEAQRQGLAAPGKLAILGHSMGSGVALGYGLAYPQTQATIAISPVAAEVTHELPHNLLLMAGQSEPGFVNSARIRLDQAGGTGGDLAAGNARRLVVVPLVEHITILFSDQAHAEARAWLDGTFGVQPGAQDRPARLVYWYLLGLLGMALAVACLAPAAPLEEPDGTAGETAGESPAVPPARPLWLRLLALAAGALGATALLALYDLLLARFTGQPASGLFGMLVGGYLVVWFGLAGLLALLVLRPALAWPSWRTVGAGLLVLAGLWLGVIGLGGQVWLHAWLIAPRLALWPLGVVGMFPWFLAVGAAGAPANAWGRLGWWLANSVVVAGALVLALLLNAGLGFLVLILPLFPVMLGLHAAAAARQRSPWAFALSAAGLVSWMVLAVFPLS